MGKQRENWDYDCRNWCTGLEDPKCPRAPPLCIVVFYLPPLGPCPNLNFFLKFGFGLWTLYLFARCHKICSFFWRLPLPYNDENTPGCCSTSLLNLPSVALLEASQKGVKSSVMSKSQGSVVLSLSASFSDFLALQAATPPVGSFNTGTRMHKS